MQKPRVYIDGYNLSLQQGTGVATYARNLSLALRELGAEVGVLYGGQSRTVSRNPLLREVSFFDAPLEGRPRLKDMPRNISADPGPALWRNRHACPRDRQRHPRTIAE